jgi:hypothetical protein
VQTSVAGARQKGGGADVFTATKSVPLAGDHISGPPSNRPPNHGDPVRHSVISGPIRFDAGSRAFTFRSGTKVQYPASQLAPVIERFCSEVTRRTGLPLTSAVDHAEDSR